MQFLSVIIKDVLAEKDKTIGLLIPLRKQQPAVHK